MHAGSEDWPMYTVAQFAKKVNAGSDRKVSEYTVHLSLLRICRVCNRFLSHHVDGACITYQGNTMAPGCTMERRQASGGS